MTDGRPGTRDGSTDPSSGQRWPLAGEGRVRPLFREGIQGVSYGRRLPARESKGMGGIERSSQRRLSTVLLICCKKHWRKARMSLKTMSVQRRSDVFSAICGYR